MAKPWLRRTLWIVVLVAALLWMLLHALPWFALKAANAWYEDQGQDYRLSVALWRFAPFRTELELDGLTLTHPGQGSGETRFARFYLSLNPWDLFSHQLTIDNLTLEGLSVDARLEQADDGVQTLSVAGLSLPLTAADDGTAAAEQDADRQATDAAGADQDAGAPWVLQVNEVFFNGRRLAWQVALPELRTTGELAVEKLQLADFSSAADSPLPVTLAAKLNQFVFTNAETLSLNKALSLEVAGSVQHPLSAPQWQGDVNVSQFDLTIPDVVHAVFASLSLNGIQADAGAQTLAGLSLRGLGVQAQGAPEVQLAELGVADAWHRQEEKDGTEVQSQGLQQLTLKQLVVGDQQQPLLSLDSYRLQDASFSGNDLSAGMQSYHGLVARVVRDASGNLAGLPVAAADTANTETAAAEQPAAAADTDQPAAVATTLAIALAGLMQADDDEGQNAAVYIRDESVAPVVDETLTIQELRVGESQASFDSGVVHLSQPVTVYVLAGLDQYNRIELEAELSLYVRDGEIYPQGRIRQTIRQLDLVAFNGYVAQAIGYHVERGMLDLDVDVTIDKAQLDGKVKILLRNSRFVPVDKKVIDRVSKQISMPVDTALDLLRDDNGNVKVTVPVSGDLSDPDVGISDITSQLSQLALKQGAMYYLRQSLQPYGLFLSLASYAGDYLMAIRLDSLEYEQGSAELTDDHQKNLQKVAQLMREKEDLELQVCPFVSKAEAKAAGDGWPELAKQRSAAVKAWLADKTEEDGKSLATRVTLCQPQKGEKAEVVLGLN
ncbi:MAG: DUF748 domain-containing protein [Pseudomonadota bacterium]|nr:DUF748 domain-containing protein [Pseudomonadota bacterium]